MDTAQLSGAAETDPNAQLQNAADAFKAFDNPASVRPRDELGQFAKEQPDETEDEAEPEALAEDEEVDEDDDEAADEAQPMPPSWPAEKAAQWAQLPAEAQAVIAEREAERDRGLNLKMQESANARKAAEAVQAQANARLDEFNRVIETVEAIYKSPEPDARAFGYGTVQFNEAAYVAAHQQWQQTEHALAQLNGQRDAALKEKTEADVKAAAEWRRQHETVFAPKLLADVPELKDAAKAPAVAQELVRFAIDNGIPEDVFVGDAANDITSAQLHLLWKAQQFDKMRAAKPAAAKPKPAGPAVTPGVSSPRSAQKATRQRRNFDRLTREGSLDAAAAVFKDLM